MRKYLKISSAYFFPNMLSVNKPKKLFITSMTLIIVFGTVLDYFTGRVYNSDNENISCFTIFVRLIG